VAQGERLLGGRKVIDPRKQPLRLKIEVTYDALVYEGDPDDAYEIADLEKGEIGDDIEWYLDDLLQGVRDFKLTLQPE
jgi:hypothetical protein